MMRSVCIIFLPYFVLADLQTMKTIGGSSIGRRNDREYLFPPLSPILRRVAKQVFGHYSMQYSVVEGESGESLVVKKWPTGSTISLAKIPLLFLENSQLKQKVENYLQAGSSSGPATAGRFPIALRFCFFNKFSKEKTIHMESFSAFVNPSVIELLQGTHRSIILSMESEILNFLQNPILSEYMYPPVSPILRGVAKQVFAHYCMSVVEGESGESLVVKKWPTGSTISFAMIPLLFLENSKLKQKVENYLQAGSSSGPATAVLKLDNDVLNLLQASKEVQIEFQYAQTDANGCAQHLLVKPCPHTTSVSSEQKAVELEEILKLLKRIEGNSTFATHTSWIKMSISLLIIGMAIWKARNYSRGLEFWLNQMGSRILSQLIKIVLGK